MFFAKVIESIKMGTYSEGLTDRVLLVTLEHLKQSAEIYTVAYPELAGEYLMQRRMVLYRLLAAETEADFMPDCEQAKQLLFVHEKIFRLLMLYSELFEGWEDDSGS